MQCPHCKQELEIFIKGAQEIQVCPGCLCALIDNESDIEVLKKFCTQEILVELFSNILDESLFENSKKMLQPDKNISCPKCHCPMRDYDFDKKTNFSVNKCEQCGVIWIKKIQIPLVALSFLTDSQQDISFKKSIKSLYALLGKKRYMKARPLEEVLAPYIVVPLSLLPIPVIGAGSYPVGDNIIRKVIPYTTISIIVICTLFFFTGSEFFPTLSLQLNKAMENFQIYRFFTYALLHAGLFHLLGNMWFLWLFGRSVEDKLGWLKYLLLFIICAITSGILFAVTIADKSIPVVGASGAISGIIGAYLILFPKAKIKFVLLWKWYTKKTTTYIPSYMYILVWILFNLLMGTAQAAGVFSGVAYWGHIGGFIGGILFAEIYKNINPDFS